MTPRPGDKALGYDIGACPECGRGIGIVVTADGDPGVSHEEPMCSRFNELDPAAWLEWVRTVREAGEREGVCE